MTLGEIIREYRAEHLLSQEAFAELSGISKGYVSMLENNKNPRSGLPITPTVSVVAKAARAMGLTSDDLVRRMDGAPAEDDFPEITMIARAGSRMTPERRRDMLRMLQIAFPEAFRDDDRS